VQEFSYSPTAVLAERKIVVTEDGITHADGPKRAWADLSGVELQSQRVRGVEFATMRLEFGDAVETISWSGVGPELAEFFGLVRETLVVIQGVYPELQVRFGASGGYRIAYLILGVLIVATGVFLAGVSIAMAAEGDWGVAVAMGSVGLLTVLWGVLTIAGQRPGKAQKTMPISETIEMMAGAPTSRSDASSAG
jgi:hypothetical protein